MDEHRSKPIDEARAASAWLARWESARARERELLSGLRQALARALAAEAPVHGVSRAVLFGSGARGDYRDGESDLDLLVDGERIENPVALAADLERHLHAPIHVLVRHRAPATLVARADREGVEVYAG